MEALKENLEEIEIGSSVESFHKFLDSQKELFHSQIDQLQRILVNQCNLTGVNPLSQEMAAGAMSIKIGKRPRDLLNPKAIKYMQAVFSLKDAISKKESREISAQFGVTVTQVRDFFASQRSRVRKLVRLSREKVARTTVREQPQDEVPASSDPMMPINLAPLNSVLPDPDPVPLNFAGPNGGPVNSVGPSSVEESPSCSTQDDILPGLNDLDKNFVENIFILLRKEETFSGQEKLMEWILQIQNPSVLNWFLTKGGVMILATWLSQAAAEEQTSILLVALKVLCHLPLHKALPEHMSAILHSVNRLRFYRTSDISNRARVLLSRWSKLFARSQAMKKPSGVKSSVDAQEMILKQSIDEIMGNELWQPNVGNPEDGVTTPGTSENTRKVEPSLTLKLLPSSTDDSSKKHVLGVSFTRERRKVQLVEQPGQKTASKSPQATKAVSISQSRPMSTDDIQKAKMRALFMQGKYGKTGSSSSGTNIMKTESSSKPSNTQSSNLFPASKAPLQPKTAEHEKPLIVPSKISDKREGSLDPKHKMDLKEPLGGVCRRIQIPWKTPSEIKLNSLWRVGTGENSKEVDVQKNRNRREIETVYRTVLDIPSNPKEPWDLEMDYDDTLTPDIPVEQPADADADAAETQVSHNENIVENTVVAPALSLTQNEGGSAAEPDLELLAVLLKNPELVFALTNAQGGNLSAEETVKLLDMIKKSGAGLANSLNGFGGEVREKVEVSLPSPTPSSNPGTSGWRPEDAKNPFSQQGSRRNRVAYTDPVVSTHNSSVDKLTGLVQPQNQASSTRMPQQQASLQMLPQQVQGAMPPFSWPQTTSSTSENRQPSLVLPSHESFPSKSTVLQTQSSEMGLGTKNLPFSSHSLHNLSATAGTSMRIETVNNVKPVPSVSFPMNAPDRRQDSFPMPIATPTPTRPHSLVSEPAVVQASTGNLVSVPDSWRGRQRLGSTSASQVNQTNNDGMFRGSVQPQVRSGPPWERNEYKGDEGFESWSPENSPGRSPEYMQGRNHPGSGRINTGWKYTPDNRSRQQNHSGRWDHYRNGNRRWR